MPHTNLLPISITVFKAKYDTSLMERVYVNPQERIWGKPKPIRAPVVLWLGSHPLVIYPGQQEGLPAISFAEAQGGKGHATATTTPVTLGRRFDNTLTFKNELTTISAIHAQISLQDNLWHVEDRGSTNGTFMEKIPTCPPGEKPLPKRVWHLIPDGSSKITFSTVHRSNLTKDQDLPFLALTTLHDMGVTVLTGPFLDERPPFVLPLHQPITIGSDGDNDFSVPNQYSFAPQHATVINTGNGVLIRDNHATGYTKVRVQPSA